MKIILIRHSKTLPTAEIPITEWALTDEGVEKAKFLSSNNDIKKSEIIYSSLQTKAIETALLLAKPNAIPIRTDNRLTEVTSFTTSFEPDFEKYTKQHENVYNGQIERLDNGESLTEALTRFNQAIEEIVFNEQDKEYIAIVSHGNILGLFTSQYLDIEPLKAQKLLKMPDYAIFDWEQKKFITLFSQFT